MKTVAKIFRLYYVNRYPGYTNKLTSLIDYSENCY